MNFDPIHRRPPTRSGSTGLTDHQDRSSTPKITPVTNTHITRPAASSQDGGSTPIISHRTKIILNIAESSTPGSPSSSSGLHSIPTAEKRLTQVSKYLISNDFKSSFATKLNELRKRETDLPPPPAYLSALAAADPSHFPHRRPPIDHTPSDSILSTKPTSPLLASDRKLIQELPEPPQAQLPSTSIESSCPLEIASYEDPEQQNAKYEVIAKLADQLADQIEENDHLLYELGVVRSNHARLQAYATDKEDEVACLNNRIRQLESLISNNSSSSTHDPQACAQERSQSEASIHSLNLQAQQLRRAVCRLQLELYKLRNPDRATPNARSRSGPFPNETKSVSVNPSLHDARRNSWSGVSTQSTWRHSKQALNQSTWPIFNRPGQSFCTFLEHTKPDADDPSPNSERITNPDDLGSLKAQVEQLRAELSDCQEASMTSETTLQALVESISNDPDLYRTLSRAPSGSRELAGRKATTGLGIISSTITERKALSEVNSNLNIVKQNVTDGESSVIASSVPVEQHSYSPLLSLTNFGFGGWGRKQDSSRSSTMKTGVISSGEAGRTWPPRTTSESKNERAVDQEQQNILPSPPMVDREGGPTFRTFTLGSLFNPPCPSATSPTEYRQPAFSSSPGSSPNSSQRPTTSTQGRSITTPPMTVGQLAGDHPVANGPEEPNEGPQGSRQYEQEPLPIDLIHESGPAAPSMISSNLSPSDQVDPSDMGAPNPDANLDELKQSVVLDPNPSSLTQI